MTEIKGGASGRATRATHQAPSGLDHSAGIPDAERTQICCLICTRMLWNFDSRDNHPMGGVEFTSPGHYGTIVFDPMNGDRLAINICDWCLAEFGKAGAVLQYTPGKRKPKLWRVPRVIADNVTAKYITHSASGIETEGHDGETRHGAKHESPPEGDAHD